MDRAIRSAYVSRAENRGGSGLNGRLFSSGSIVLPAGSERSIFLESFGAVLCKTLILRTVRSERQSDPGSYPVNRKLGRETCYLGWRLRQNFTRGRFCLID